MGDVWLGNQGWCRGRGGRSAGREGSHVRQGDNAGDVPCFPSEGALRIEHCTARIWSEIER